MSPEHGKSSDFGSPEPSLTGIHPALVYLICFEDNLCFLWFGSIKFLKQVLVLGLPGMSGALAVNQIEPIIVIAFARVPLQIQEENIAQGIVGNWRRTAVLVR